MKLKTILKSIAAVLAERQASDASHEVEIRACHARINLLQSALCNAMEALAKGSSLDTGTREAFDETVRILRDAAPSEDLLRLAARSGFCGDQTMAEILQIKAMIDQLPDE